MPFNGVTYETKGKWRKDDYECHKCHTRHSTDNMVAYCASCYSVVSGEMQEMIARDGVRRLRDRIVHLEAELKKERKQSFTRSELCRDEQIAHKKCFAKLVKCQKELAAIRRPQPASVEGEGTV